MPLLDISLLVLLLLPLCLSCDSKRTPEEVQKSYFNIVNIHLNDAKENTTILLQNLASSSTCPELKHKTRNCTPHHDKKNIVNILHILACRMIRLSYTDRLIESVVNSIQCPCPDRSTKDHTVMPKNRRTATRRRRNEQRKAVQREIKTLCKANAVLSAMTECYELLNTRIALQQN